MEVKKQIQTNIKTDMQRYRQICKGTDRYAKVHTDM